MFSACAARIASADGRFGDSTWVAPASPGSGEHLADAAREAPRDHERRWESALRAPFRVATFPLRLVSNGFEAVVGYVGPRYLDPKAPHPPIPGPVITPSFSIGGLNDIGIGPAITWLGFPTAAARLNLSGTWSAIDHRRARFSELIGERRAVGFRVLANYERKPDRRYYGIGNDAKSADLSYFLLESSSAEAALLLGASPPRQLRIDGGFSSMSPRRASHGMPPLEDVFSPALVPFELQATRELWYGVAGNLAALDDGATPSRGVDGRFDVRRAAGMRAGDPDYDQWRLDGRAYIPVFAKRRVIAIRCVYAGVNPRPATATLPYYRLAISEDGSRFAGYSSERFRDRQLLHARIEYRWRVFHQVSALALYDLGEVARRTGEFRLTSAHKSYGGGLRLGRSDQAALRLEVAKSVEGLHASLSLGSDF